MKTSISLMAWIVVLVPTFASAAPMLSLVKTGTASTTSDEVPFGPGSYNLDLRLSTDGNAVSGLGYFIQTDSADVVTYGATPVTALNNPFTISDLKSVPASGAVVRETGGHTGWFTFNPDYTAFTNNAIATYQFNTSNLAQGTYIFTPIGEGLANSSTEISSFAVPGTFSLTVVPEPTSIGLFVLGAATLSVRRRRVSGEQYRPCVSKSAVNG